MRHKIGVLFFLFSVFSVPAHEYVSFDLGAGIGNRQDYL